MSKPMSIRGAGAAAAAANLARWEWHKQQARAVGSILLDPPPLVGSDSKSSTDAKA
jgi:hypothetical protein